MRRLIAILSACWLCCGAYGYAGDIVVVDNNGFFSASGGTTTRYSNVYAGTNILYDDFEAPMIYAIKIAGKDPTDTEVTNSTYAPLYVGNANKAEAGSIHINHRWREGTTLYPHLHMIQNGAGASKNVWQLKWSWFNRYTNGMAYADGDDVKTGVSTVTNTPLDWPINQMVSFDSIAVGTNMISSSQFNFYVERLSDDGADTNANGVYVLQFDLHGQVYRMGESL